MAEKEYIDRQEIIEKIREQGIYGSGYSDEEREDDVVDMIESIPAADVRPVVRGKWVQTKDEFGIYNKCSACGKEYYCGPIAPFNFCPNCGADMREEAADAEDQPAT